MVGLLLSRSAELLQSHDKHGKTGLHIAATHGHYQMVEVLLGKQIKLNVNFLKYFCLFRANSFESLLLIRFSFLLLRSD